MRLATEKDLPAIDRYCKQYNIKTPTKGFIFVNEDDNGQINGVACAVSQWIIEPMIGDNPVLSVRLYNTLMGALMALQADKVWAIPHDDHLVSELEKLHFKVIDKVTILEKVL